MVLKTGKTIEPTENTVGELQWAGKSHFVLFYENHGFIEVKFLFI